tara:strand:+ start:1346 stop:2125 length:780 start_codon:yes stop_codon:yes gene_type:complete
VLPKYLKPLHVEKSNLIRIGPKTDGGYVVDKRILGKNKILVTCGLNDDWEFEKDFIKKNGDVSIIAFDHTVNNEFWIKRFKKDFISLLLLKKLRPNKILDVFKYLDYLLFFRKNKIHYKKKIVNKSKNNSQKSISEILKPLNDIVLKVDIEGDEYKILNDIKKNSKKIIFLIIEFHDIHKNLRKLQKFLNNLDLKIIHIHANNYGGISKKNVPKVIELSLINSKKIKIKKIYSKRKYPIVNLDYKNLKRRDEIKIRFNN